jgi:hypothetical protein
MAGQSRDIRHDHMISYSDVMRDVAVSQDLIARANDCDLTIRRRAVDRYVLAKRIEITDLSARDPAFPFQILSFQSNAREGKNFVAASKGGVAVNHNMRVQAATFSQSYVLADHAIGADLTIRPDLSLRMNDRARVNHRMLRL